MDDKIWMSIKDYAKYKGVAYQTIHDTIGILIPKEATKKKNKHVFIDRGLADQYYTPKQKLDISHKQANKPLVQHKQKESLSFSDNDDVEIKEESEKTKPTISEYQAASIKDKVWKAKKTELEVRLKSGEYYRKVDVDNYIKSAIIATKDQILMLPDKISDNLGLEEYQKKQIYQLCEDTLLNLVKLKDRL